jgi:hypothetical protein
MERLVAAAGVDRLVAAAGVDRRDPAAGVDATAAQRLPDADTYPPSPQRAVDSASTPAVLPAAAADLAPH